MRTLLPALTLLLATAAAPAQTIALAAASAAAASGTVCDPWTCTPAPLAAPRGSQLALIAAGAIQQPHFLLVSIPPALCVPVPGLAGSLIAPLPAAIAPLPLSWGRIYVTGPGQVVCSGWMGFGSLPLPATIPVGSQFLLQALALVPRPVDGAQWTLSNAVALTLQ